MCKLLDNNIHGECRSQSCKRQDKRGVGNTVRVTMMKCTKMKQAKRLLGWITAVTIHGRLLSVGNKRQDKRRGEKRREEGHTLRST